MPWSDTVRLLSGFFLIVVPSVPYLRSWRAPPRGTSPNPLYQPLTANGSPYISRLRSGLSA
jgi:hypothetical protein